jgi:extradiol dioxygenase
VKGHIAKLGYVGVQTPRAEEFRTWGPEVLGCMVGPDGDDGAVRLKIDDADYRLSLHPGDDYRYLYAGWEVVNHRDLDAAVKRLEDAGAKPRFADQELADQRGVDKLVQFEDPFGQPLELFCYQESNYSFWHPPRPHAGFVTKEQGLGHVVFAVPDARKAVDFYIDAMGFIPSEILKMPEPLGEMWFLRVNPRHHSVAFLEVPNSVGLHHVYLESVDIDDVGYSYYDVLGGDANPDLQMAFGRHIGDQVISYYIHTAGGFMIEYGWGGLAIDDMSKRSPNNLNFRNGKRQEMWGHKFRFQPNEAVHPYQP